MLSGLDPRRIGRNDNVHLESEEFSSERREPLGPSVREPVIDRDIPTVDVPQFTKPVRERLHEMLNLRCARGDTEPADPRDLRGLLREGGERRGEREQQTGNDVPSSHEAPFPTVASAASSSARLS